MTQIFARSQNTEIYNLNIIQITGNVELGESLLVNGEATQVQGITKSGNEYSVGEQADVAQGSGYAQNTVVLKVDGNLTIASNITLTAVKSTANLGGPKGLIIYCTGELTNNGTINMTARGAKAVGQNLYLYKNSDDTFEYVPKDGCAGGASATAGSRKSGGGGGAGRANPNGNLTPIGYGTMGTSFSGGTGSGAKNIEQGGTNGTANGGKGGDGGKSFGCGGGAGNPGGTSFRSDSGDKILTHGASGTGGLVVIFCNTSNKLGNIVSNGSSGGSMEYQKYGGGTAGGRRFWCWNNRYIYKRRNTSFKFEFNIYHKRRCWWYSYKGRI